jgi:ANTAR domain/GAF domain
MSPTIVEQLLAAVSGRCGVWAADGLCRACVALFGVDAAVISLVIEGTNAGTLGASGAPARTYDELQFTLGEGPCLDTVAHRSPTLIADLADPAEVRWPAYRSAMLAHGIRGLYAVPVVIAGDCIGALELFCQDPATLGTQQLAGGLMAAELAQLPALNLLGNDLLAITDPDDDAWTELNTLCRAEVSQATGVLVAQLGIGPTEALVRLRGHAYATGRSATDVAHDILEHRLHLDAD